MGTLPTTRERLLESAMRLFAERGYEATTVGDIEGAAGLSPRAGAFYRHFASKEQVFHAAVERWAAEVESFPETIGALLPLGDVAAELTVVARGALVLLDRQADLFRVLARDGAAFPEMVKSVHTKLVQRGYELMQAVLAAHLPDDVPAEEVRAMAASALGALVHYREDEALYGTPPAGADPDTFVRIWVQVWTCWLNHRTQTRSLPAPRRSRRGDKGRAPIG